jgi:flavin reductase (DIM6/NTAB) family NADH-FMN oxidoreductase RutF
MTATAVCSVTAEPPSASIIVNRSNRSHGMIARTKKFAVNFLANDQRHLAAHFASKLPEPINDIQDFPYLLGARKIRPSQTTFVA